MGSEWIFFCLGIGIVAAGIVVLICIYIRREKQFRDAEAWYNTGLGIAHLGRLENNPQLFKQAIECYDNALQLRPDYPEAWNNKGNALTKFGQHEEAVKCLATALKIRKRFTIRLMFSNLAFLTASFLDT